MQASRLRMVAEECTRDLADEGAIDVTGYYFHKTSWWDAADGSEAAVALRPELAKCLAGGHPYRATKSPFSNFPLPEIGAVIRARFAAPLRHPRPETIHRVVQRSFRNASNAFGVRFNPKTGLLAQSPFQDLMIDQLKSMAALGTSTEKSDDSISPALCILALDIDHFKQVNDSHGHAYGDLVIRSFGVRIDRALTEFVAQSSTEIQGTCAHVSGEEFFCLAWGPVSTGEFEELAEFLLSAVRDHPLPSNDDLTLLASTYVPDQLAIPKLKNRNITCSIGGVVTGAPAGQDTKRVMEKLLNQSDLALYKSKNQGRNRVTFFPTILQNGGRVIEYKADVAICIIDIGEDVGVIKGQEFVVLHPEFTGTTPYVLDDGRSRKTLGMLPRTSICTITAFDVQRQISFCRFSEDRFLNTSIPRNAALEAIPLGTLSVPVLGSVAPIPADILLETVASIAETQQKTIGRILGSDLRSFAVVGIRNEKELLSSFGPASVNRGLAAACRNLQKLKRIQFIGQLEPTKLLLQYGSFTAAESKELDAALAQAEEDTGGRVRFMAGVFAPGLKERNAGSPTLPDIDDIKVRLDLARYAASQEATRGGKRIEIFSHDTAWWILARLRQLREFKRGLADYQRFSQIGVHSAELDNAAGLLASAMRDFATAEILYLKAADQAPASEIVYRLNAISMQVSLDNMQVAASTADAIDQASLEANYTQFPFGVACLAIAYAHQALASGEISQARRAEEWGQRALQLDLPEYIKTRLQVSLDRLITIARDPK